MSLKLVPFESLGAVSYSPSIVTMAVSVSVCEIFSVKEWRDFVSLPKTLSPVGSGTPPLQPHLSRRYDASILFLDQGW